MKNAQMIIKEPITNNSVMYIAFELSNSSWKLVFSNGLKRRQRNIMARNLKQIEEEIEQSKKRFKMTGEIRIVSCYEAGRDGFWLHRYLHHQGIENYVVDSSSIEVSRRKRRAKTDRVDAEKLLNMLIRYKYGERKHWSVLRIPSEAEEDARRIDRELKRLKQERTSHTNRIKSLLILHGLDRMSITSTFRQQLDNLRLWNGKPVPDKLQEELLREYERYSLVQEQLKDLKSYQRERIKGDQRQDRQVRALMSLCGVGEVSSWDLVYEFFGWRRFKNGKQVGAAAGLTPTPYESGSSSREQGISKAGNRRVRSLMIELAWQWVRHQAQSSLSQWFETRFAGGGKRMRKIGIVALARKLLISLWKYLETGVLPEGARLKAAV